MVEIRLHGPYLEARKRTSQAARQEGSGLAKGRPEDASLRQVSKHPLPPYRLYVAWTRVLHNHQDRSVAKGFIGRESLYVVNGGGVAGVPNPWD